MGSPHPDVASPCASLSMRLSCMACGGLWQGCEEKTKNKLIVTRLRRSNGQHVVVAGTHLEGRYRHTSLKTTGVGGWIHRGVFKRGPPWLAAAHLCCVKPQPFRHGIAH